MSFRRLVGNSSGSVAVASFIGTIALAGAFDPSTTAAQPFAGTVAPSGAFDSATTAAASPLGVVTPWGAFVASTTASSSFAGTCSPSGSFAAGTIASASCVGTCAPSGTFTATDSEAPVSFVGTCTPSGTFAGSATAAQAFVGTCAPSGTFTAGTTSAASFTGTAAPSGTFSGSTVVRTAFAGTCTPIGVFDPAGSVSFVGTCAPSGAFDAVAIAPAPAVMQGGAGGGGHVRYGAGWRPTPDPRAREVAPPVAADAVAPFAGTCAPSGAFDASTRQAFAPLPEVDRTPYQYQITARGDMLPSVVGVSGTFAGRRMFDESYVEAQRADAASQAVAARHVVEVERVVERTVEVERIVERVITLPAPAIIVPRRDSVAKGAALRTLRHAATLRANGLGVRKGKIPKQVYPKLIEMEYARAMIAQLDRARGSLAQLAHELPTLLASAAAKRGDRMDADTGEAGRARDLIRRAGEHLASATAPTAIDELAQTFADRTVKYQAVQLGRQVRAALGADVFASDRRVPTMVQHFVAENAALIKSITPQVMTQIEQLTTRAFTNGTPHAQLAEEIADRFDVGESRARLIARDQVGKLYGQVNAERQKDLGIKGFIWRTAGDERVREEHELLNGQAFTYDDPPDEGLPGEPIQCRCSAEPDFSTMSDDDEDSDAGDDATPDDDSES